MGRCSLCPIEGYRAEAVEGSREALYRGAKDDFRRAAEWSKIALQKALRALEELQRARAA